MTTTEGTVPAYRKPWTHGAAAYVEVDTFEGIKASLYRKRVAFTARVKVGTPLHNTQVCAYCGKPLSTQAKDASRVESAYVSLNPRTRTAVFRHYVCAWSALFESIAAIRIGI